MLIFDPQGLLSCAHLTNLFLEAFKSGGAITLYLLSPLWSFSPSSPIPCFFKKSLKWISLGLSWMQHWVLIDSGLAVPYSRFFGTAVCQKEWDPVDFAVVWLESSVFSYFLMFLSSFPAFSWFCVDLELENEGLKATLIGSAFLLTTTQAISNEIKWAAYLPV